MTPQQAKELLPIITAFVEGKEIEYLIDGKWETATGRVCFDCETNRYRIKREPIKAWVVVFSSGTRILFGSKANAELYLKENPETKLIELTEKP